MKYNRYVLVDILLALCIIGVLIYNNILADDIEYIDYITMYKGFITESNTDSITPPTGSLVFQNREDWSSFKKKYLPGIDKIISSSGEIDFNKESICYMLTAESKGDYGITSELESLSVADDKLIPQYKNESNNKVYVLNNSATKHHFLILAKVSKKALPNKLKNIYKD